MLIIIYKKEFLMYVHTNIHLFTQEVSIKIKYDGYF